MTLQESRFIQYSDDVESLQPGEEETFDRITATLLHISKTVGERQRHTVRSVHAKSHGLLKAELEILADPRTELRQGLFAKPGRYGAILRFSTNPGDILSDHISTQRGLSIKVVGVDGEMFPNHKGNVTQDFVLNNSNAFHASNAKDFLVGIATLDKHVNDSNVLKQAVSSGAQIAEEALEALGSKSALLKGFGHPPTEPLGETYFSAAALRYGDYFSFE
jgi:catalase